MLPKSPFVTPIAEVILQIVVSSLIRPDVLDVARATQYETCERNVPYYSRNLPYLYCLIASAHMYVITK